MAEGHFRPRKKQIMAKKASKPKKAQKPTRPAGKATPKRRPTSSGKKKNSPRTAQASQKAGQKKSSAPLPKKMTPSGKTSRKASGGRRGGLLTQTLYSFPPPVSPRPEQLPLCDPNWTWEGFQAFCLELLSRHPATKNAGKNHHFGKQGDAQEGIDLFADMENGEHWGLQCKKEKRFTEAGTKNAINATTYKADKYIILLSIEATVAVRKVFRRRRKWDVWDVRDISQKVRELSLEDARRLLNAHFGPAWRKAFLDVSAVSTFPTAEVFFRPLLHSSMLFNHTWSLVGRTEQLEQLNAFADSQEQRVAILTGRGGIGKTKLLNAFASNFVTRHKDTALRFVADELPLTQESLDDLPQSPCMVVADDAHRREDLGVLLSYAQQRAQPLKLVFSSRPQGMDHLTYLLRNTGFDPQEICHVDPVMDLTRDEVGQLARQVLGGNHEHLADRLTAVTKDSPLVTVIGGKLLKERKVDPQLLERDDDFRTTVLSAFRDVLIGELGQQIEPEFCRMLLHLIAAVAPVYTENGAFQAAASEFLGANINRVVNAMSVLENHGVLLRRGYSVRITPDVLSDHLLHHACLTSESRRTGYAERVFEKFSPVYPTQVFRNLAELDWRVHRATGDETDLLAGIWRNFFNAFAGSNNLARCAMLDLAKEVAYYQPGETLELVQFAIRNPTKFPEPEWAARHHPFTQEHVLGKLPAVLRHIAYSITHLPRCCDLLWDLGRDDDRKLNPYPDHAMRILTELARYEPDKHLYYNQVLLEAAARWLKAPDAHSHLYSPLDVLDPLLAKTGTSVHGQGHGFVMRSFHCSKESTQLLRDGAIDLIASCLDVQKLGIVFRALKSLEEALREPTPYLNMTISNEERMQWTPDRLRVLAIIDDFARRNSHPIVLMRIHEICRIAAIHGSSDEVKQKARSLLSSIPDSFNLRLTRLLCQSHHHLWLVNEDEKPSSWQQQQERVNALGREVAEEFLQKYPEPQDGFMSLSQRSQEIIDSGKEVHPWLLLHWLSEANEAYSDRLCELVLASPDCPLAFTFGSLVAILRRRNEGHALSLIRNAVQTGHPVLCRALASEYWQQGWLTAPCPEDFDFMEGLIRHLDFGVRRAAVFALPNLSKSQPRAAIALALKLDVTGSNSLMEELCAILANGPNGIEPDELTDTDLKEILAKLENAQRIDGHFVQQFIAYASKRDPQSVIQLLLNRIENEEVQSDGGRALPFDGFHFSLEGLVENAKYYDFLRTIRDRMAGASGMVRFWLPPLFKEVSLNFSPTSLKVLGEWVESGEPEKIVLAASILSAADPGFVFEQVGFVTNLLERAFKAGNQCYQRVFNYIYNCARTGSKQGVSGQPFPQDIALRERAKEMSAQFLAGTPAHQLFESLKKYAEAEIKNQAASDQEMDD
jgi:hypothetical protein